MRCWDSVVAVGIELQTARQSFYVSTVGKRKQKILFTNATKNFCATNTLLFDGYLGIVPGSKAALGLKQTDPPIQVMLRITGAISLISHLPPWRTVGQICLQLGTECGKYFLLIYCHFNVALLGLHGAKVNITLRDSDMILA